VGRIRRGLVSRCCLAFYVWWPGKQGWSKTSTTSKQADKLGWMARFNYDYMWRMSQSTVTKTVTKDRMYLVS